VSELGVKDGRVSKAQKGVGNEDYLQSGMHSFIEVTVLRQPCTCIDLYTV
jgi:hypothetical protein